MIAKKFFVLPLLAYSAVAQSLSVSNITGITNCVAPLDRTQVDQFSAGDPGSLIVKSTTGGSVPFGVFPEIGSFLAASPNPATATPQGTKISLFPADPRLLHNGAQSALLAIAVAGATVPTLVVTITANCVPVPSLTSDPDINVTVPANSAPISTQIGVQGNSNNGGPAKSAIKFTIQTATDQATSWITAPDQNSTGQVSPTGSTAVTITIDPRGLAPGSYIGRVNFNDSTFNSSARTDVHLTVTPATATLQASTNPIAFSATANGPNPSTQSLPVTSSNTQQNISFTATPSTNDGRPWLLVNGSATAVSATTPSTLSIGIATAGLAAGTFNGKVTIAGGGASLTVPVTLTVTAPAGPVINADGIVNGASFLNSISPGSWVTIRGQNLAPDTPSPGRLWRSDEIASGTLPMTLDGVSVTIGGQRAVMYYISNTQLNILVPPGLVSPATLPVVVMNSKGTSAAVNASVQSYGPALFQSGGTPYIAALHLDYTQVGKPNFIPGLAATPARPGEIIQIYGTGFGPSNPAQPVGIVFQAASPLTSPVQVTVGGRAAVAQAYVVGPGLNQINVTIPADVPDGDQPIIMQIGGQVTQTTALVTVQR